MERKTMKKLTYVSLILTLILSFAGCAFPTPEEVKQSVDNKELNIDLSGKALDDFIEPYVEILESLKGLSDFDFNMSDADKEDLYDFCKDMSMDEFSDVMNDVTQKSSDLLDNLFGESSSGLSDLLDEAQKELGN